MSVSCSEVSELDARSRVVPIWFGAEGAEDTGRIVCRLWEPPYSEGRVLPVVLLLHGSFGSWTHWLRNIPALAARYRVIAVDIPGFGDSGPAPAASDPPGMASVLWQGWRRLCDSSAGVIPAGPAPVFIAGFSLGAVYAGWLMRNFLDPLNAASLCPAGLILLAPGGLGPRDRAPPPVSPVRAEKISGGDECVTAVHRRNLKALMFAKAATIDQTALAVQEANVSRARFRRGFTSRPDWLCQALSGTNMSVLGIWGSKDALDDDVTLRLCALRANVQHADVYVVEDSGHWVGYESFQEVNLILQQWIDIKSNIWNNLSAS